MSVSTNPTLTGVNLHDVTSDKQHTLGATVTTQDGRVYRYAKNQSSSTIAANAGVEANTTTPLALTTTAAPVGSRSITTSTSIAVDGTYEDATLVVSNVKHLTSGVIAKGVSLYDPLDVALSTSASLAPSPFAVKLKASGTQLGTTEVAVPAGSYFWAFVSA